MTVREQAIAASPTSERSARENAIEGYRLMMEEALRRDEVDLVTRELALNDLFFLLVYVLGVDFANNDWVFARCREVQEEPDGFLDIWSREHFKSTVITFALTIQDILCDPTITVGIFSFNRPIAKAFMRQIKWQFESNQKLKDLFPDILYQEPEKESPMWSEDNGIVVKRSSDPKEATIEAWGVEDSQPTSKHFRLARI